MKILKRLSFALILLPGLLAACGGEPSVEDAEQALQGLDREARGSNITILDDGTLFTIALNDFTFADDREDGEVPQVIAIDGLYCVKPADRSCFPSGPWKGIQYSVSLKYIILESIRVESLTGEGEEGLQVRFDCLGNGCTTRLTQGFMDIFIEGNDPDAALLSPWPDKEGFPCKDEDVCEDMAENFRTIAAVAVANRPSPEELVSQLSEMLVGTQFGWATRQDDTFFAQTIDDVSLDDWTLQWSVTVCGLTNRQNLDCPKDAVKRVERVSLADIDPETIKAVNRSTGFVLEMNCSESAVFCVGLSFDGREADNEFGSNRGCPDKSTCERAQEIMVELVRLAPVSAATQAPLPQQDAAPKMDIVPPQESDTDLWTPPQNPSRPSVRSRDNVPGNYGSIAFSEQSGRYGYAYNYASQADAESNAVRECESGGRPGDCRSLVWFRDACGALSRASHGPYGSGWGDTQQRAEWEARQSCANAGGRDCKIVQTVCSKG